MSNVLQKSRNRIRNVENYGKITKENKADVIKSLNKFIKQSGFNEFSNISENANVREVAKIRKAYVEREEYDIMIESIKRGYTMVAEIYGKYASKSNDIDTSRLGEYAKMLSGAMKKSGKQITKEEKDYLHKSNENIKGYGNMDIVTLFENTTKHSEVVKLVEEIKNAPVPIDELYDNKIKTFEKVFRHVELTREKDIDKLKKEMRNMSLKDLNNVHRYLLKSLTIYDSDQESTDDPEQNLANNRLNDILIRSGVKKSGKKKVSKTYKNIMNERKIKNK